MLGGFLKAMMILSLISTTVQFFSAFKGMNFFDILLIRPTEH